jgi:hypothetical protein
MATYLSRPVPSSTVQKLILLNAGFNGGAWCDTVPVVHVWVAKKCVSAKKKHGSDLRSRGDLRVNFESQKECG